MKGALALSTRSMTLTAMLTALLCILGPVTLPVGAVPVSMTTAALMLIALLLGPGRACLCCGVYLGIGLLGVPVLSGFSGGLGALLGPTGGFLLGYLPMTALCGFSARTSSRLRQLTAFAAGNLLLYLSGTTWYVVQAGTEFLPALGVCVLPFLPGDVLKLAAVLTGGNAIRTRLKRAGIW